MTSQWSERDTKGAAPFAAVAGFPVNPYPRDSDILSAHIVRRFASIVHRHHLNPCEPGSDVQSSIVNTELCAGTYWQFLMPTDTPSKVFRTRFFYRRDRNTLDMIGPTFSRPKGPVVCFNSRLLRSSVYPVLCRITEIVPALRLSPGRRWSLEFYSW